MHPTVTSYTVLLVETDGRDDLQERSIRVQEKKQKYVKTEAKTQPKGISKCKSPRLPFPTPSCNVYGLLLWISSSLSPILESWNVFLTELRPPPASAFLLGASHYLSFATLTDELLKMLLEKVCIKAPLQMDSPQSWPAQTLASGHLTAALRSSH